MIIEMKNSLKYLFVLVIAVCALRGSAADSQPVDTLYFYDSWEQMLEFSPVAMMQDPWIFAPSAFRCYIETGDEDLDEKLWRKHIAFSLGDSIWLMSAYYLRQNFKGDVKNLDGYIPVFFNSKAAYIVQPGKLSVKDLLVGPPEDAEYDFRKCEYYNIDFLNRVVKRVTPTVLSQLLERYHDLQMRYEGMKDYKKQEIIEDFYFKYIDNVTQDIMYPYILDLVESEPRK